VLTIVSVEMLSWYSASYNWYSMYYIYGIRVFDGISICNICNNNEVYDTL